MAKKLKHFINPVDIFIDRQLASPWREHQLYKDVTSSSDKSWAWCPKGLTPLYVNETFSIINTIEDELIQAIDKRIHGVESRIDDTIELLSQGYRLIEIADLLGVSRWTLWDNIQKWRENCSEEEEEQVRLLASSLDSEIYG